MFRWRVNLNNRNCLLGSICDFLFVSVVTVEVIERLIQRMPALDWQRRFRNSIITWSEQNVFIRFRRVMIGSRPRGIFSAISQSVTLVKYFNRPPLKQVVICYIVCTLCHQVNYVETRTPNHRHADDLCDLESARKITEPCVNWIRRGTGLS